MHRAHVTAAFFDELVKNHRASLPKDVAHRFIKVVRVRSHERVTLFDGQGREVSGTLNAGHHEAMLEDLTFVTKTQKKPQIVLIQAALVENKMEETIKRGAEFGLDGFIILAAERAAPHAYEKLEKKVERLNALAIDACRQSGRLFVPDIQFAKSLPALFAMLKKDCLGLLGRMDGPKTIAEGEVNMKTEAIYLAVGPEGDFSPAELQLFNQAKFVPVRWSPHVLRAELAFLPALAIVQSLLGRV